MSYVGLIISYVGDNKSYVGDGISYVEDNKFYVGDIISYVGDNKSYDHLRRTAVSFFTCGTNKPPYNTTSVCAKDLSCSPLLTLFIIRVRGENKILSHLNTNF